MNFQLYRGNLHKVPDIPRRWPLAKPSISLEVFKKAITKRSEALLADRKVHAEQQRDAHIQEECGAGDFDEPEHDRKRKREHAEASGMETEADGDLRSDNERNLRMRAEADHVMKEDMSVDGVDGKVDDKACEPLVSLPSAPDALVKVEGEDVEMTVNDMENAVPFEDMEKEGERLEAPRTPAPKDEDCTKSTERIQSKGLDGGSHDEVPSLEKRRAEIQEKLKQLQETKHQLVQILKQVLITEEEAKRKSQGISQYSAPYATAGTTDLPLEQKVGSDLQSTDLEEGELEYTRNPVPPVVATSHGSHLSDVHPQMLSSTPGRHFNYQQLNKP